MKSTYLLVTASFFLPAFLFGQSGASVCPRFAAGSTITPPEDVFSVNGVLHVDLTYNTTTDADGNTLYCFTAADGGQSPTLHVNPGEHLVMTVTNMVPEQGSEAVKAQMAHLVAMGAALERAGMPHGSMDHMAGHDTATMTHGAAPAKGAELSARPDPAVDRGCVYAPMTPTSVNVHFHGANVPATCHQDEVIKTIINSGDTFEYDLYFPANEPPGLYWYHPHVHGTSELALQGGASGAIIVEGLQAVNPSLAGLPQQLLIVRDNPVPDDRADDNAPSWDLSLNYVPIEYPDYTPAVIAMKPGEKQLWHVLNASADSILDVQVMYDGVAQPLAVAGMDGVPIGSQDGALQGSSITQTHIFLPPAGRVEFVVTGPAATVKTAMLTTLEIDTGPGGDFDPARPLASIQVNGAAAKPAGRTAPEVSMVPAVSRFTNLATAKPVVRRKLYFSEVSLDAFDLDDSTIFFITVEGQQPRPFDPSNPPAIETNEGAVEDWVIENRTMERHEFHIHQIHFLVLDSAGVPLTQGQYLDTIDVPYWSGTGPYPSVTLRMDFRGVTPGDFVYHCHILAHEDAGMMATIRVHPAALRTR